MSEAALSDQINMMVAENQHLRVKSDSDDLTINLMRQQYDGLAAQVADIRAKARSEVEKARNMAEDQVADMTIERDQAIRSFKEIDTTLMQAADLIMQALRARRGDITPEQIPDVATVHFNDDRLPIARLS